LFTPETMQINLALNGPTPSAQLAGHIQSDPGSAKTQLVVHIKQGRCVKLVTQALLKNVLVVLDLLKSDGSRWRGFEANARAVLDGRDFTHRLQKKTLLRLAQLFFFEFEATPLGIQLLLTADLLLELTQVGK